MNKKILLISRHAPYGTSLARDALDVALANSVYEQDIALLFMDDGVFQLATNQNTDDINSKNIGSIVSAMELYGIEKIYLCESSLTSRGLQAKELILEDVEILSNTAIKTLLSQQDHLLSF